MRSVRLFLVLICLCLVGSIVGLAQADAIPDRPGMTIKGTVLADGKPIAGVQVSDGHEITTTDENGNYWLPSSKQNGWVYVSVPSGYEVPTEHSFPQFWASLTKAPDVAERHDFTLTRKDNDKYILLAVTDMHLANRHEDLVQFCTTFIPSVQKIAEKAEVPVYTINLGDMSFDIYWYSDSYPIEAYKKSLEIADYPTPIFHAVGNHDNDGATPNSDSTDFLSVRRYCKAIGPNYYSFNIGKTHYIVLDNIVYKNEPGGKIAEGIAGSRNYDRRVTKEQLDWLKKDLALVKDKSTPIFVAMHASAYHYKGVSDKVVSRFSTPQDSKELSDCFEGFTDVHYLTGHIHMCNTTYVNDHLFEHNIGAVCGSWWVTSEAFGLNLCPDGGPGGFAKFNVNGKKMDWQYVSIADGGKKQFRTYDMNTVREYYRTSEEVREFVKHYPLRDFSDIDDNMIYINVWDWAPDWKITVKENGKRLKVVHERAEDPLYTVSYHVVKTRDGEYLSKYKQNLLNHIFKVRASKPDSTIEVIVTDHFGRKYKEKMIRPKAFNLNME